ncbi:MAG: hypothetical protein FRX48_04088 [Lasallia pustulata]|uniref:S-adenosyl-L-methionine-dependent methyltransferase n=1 Tax=Lasallia pustulata TaxID=136370 RepID=A0A5M8PSL3_9LECA|nr:MAG: hypothetical protein FRX48_04088 [Lasallia pustulata]
MASLIAVEPNLDSTCYREEYDSAIEAEVASYTTSLASDVTDYRFEHGRRYHAYKQGSYILPNDEQESDRLDIMHKLIEVRFDGKLYNAPIGKNPARILDLGTGTGLWAIEMGDRFPTTEILGNDLSPIQPRWVPPNVRFEIDDVEADWTYTSKFDYIHCRCMGNAIRDWPTLFRQVHDYTKPGGYAEFVDLDLEWTSPDNSLLGTIAHKANTAGLAAYRAHGIEPSPGPHLASWMKAAGFEDIHAERLAMPVGTWPLDKKLKEVGAWNYLQMMEGLEAFHQALFTRWLGYEIAEVRAMVEAIRREFRNPGVHCLYYL